MSLLSTDDTIRIGEAARMAGVSTHTLRYYERLGLIAPVARGPRSERRYAESDLQWIEFLKRLRATRMPVRDMLRFAELRRRGPSTAIDRARLLDRHATRVESQIAALRRDLDAIAAKRVLLRAAAEGGDV